MHQLFRRVFSFSKTEANGSVILIILIFLFIALPFLYKTFFGVSYETFEEDRILLDSLVAKFEFEPEELRLPEIELKPFNPNSASTEELNTLGLPSFLSRRIENYRNAGGVFKVKSDLANIYDFPDSLFQVLEPFIQLPNQIESSAKVTPVERSNLSRNSAAKVINSKARFDELPLVIDLNKADTIEFQKLHGIGPAFARRLVSFREALGGYHQIDQVKDLYGMSDSLFYQIRSFLHVSDTVTLKTISINIATYQQLNSHPYINSELTKEILSAKSKYGKFKRLEDLNRLTLIDSMTKIKLGPYLKF